MSGFTGTLELGSFGSGTVRLDDESGSSTIGAAAGSSTAIFDLGASTATLESYNGGGSGSSALTNAFPLGALKGSGTGSSLSGASHSGSTFYAIGGLGLTTTFAGTVKGTTGLFIVGGALTLTGSNTYTLATTVQTNGSLFADNTSGSATGTSTVLVAGSPTAGFGTLGGSGTITGATTVNSPTAGVAAFADGGLIAPGAAGVAGPVGTLTLTGGLTLNDYSNLAYTLNGASTVTGDDLINTAALATPDGLTQVDFSFTNSASLVSGATYDLINYTGALTGNPALWSATGVPGGYTAAFSDTGPSAGQVDVTFTAVPEPASIGVLGISVLGLLRRRRARV